MTRIVFVNRFYHPDTSATAQVLRELATGLRECGQEVHVIAGDTAYAGGRLAADDPAAHDGVVVHRVRGTALGRHRLAFRAVDYLTFALGARRQLRRIAGRGDTVVALTDPPLIGAAIAPLVRGRGATFVQWWQDVFPEIAAAAFGRALPGSVATLAGRYRDRALRLASTNVAIGERMAERLLSLGAPPERVRIIPNWANERTLFPANAPDPVYRNRYGPEARLLVGYSGNLGRAHGIDTVVAAAELLRDEPAIRFVWVGAGHHHRALESEIERRRLSNAARFDYAPLEDVPRSLGAFDLHLVVLSPDMEGLAVPSKTYAAFAVGRPVVFIGDPDGEIARTVRRFGCGWAIADGDAVGLAALLRSLPGSPELAKRGQAAAAAHRSHFSRAIAVERWYSLLVDRDAEPAIPLA